MKNRIFKLTSTFLIIFSFIAFSQESKCNNDKKVSSCETTIVELCDNSNLKHIELASAPTTIDCFDCYCQMYNTYKTEYCCNVKCDNRTLFKCYCDSKHQVWYYWK